MVKNKITGEGFGLGLEREIMISASATKCILCIRNLAECDVHITSKPALNKFQLLLFQLHDFC